MEKYEIETDELEQTLLDKAIESTIESAALDIRYPDWRIQF